MKKRDEGWSNTGTDVSVTLTPNFSISSRNIKSDLMQFTLQMKQGDQCKATVFYLSVKYPVLIPYMPHPSFHPDLPHMDSSLLSALFLPDTTYKSFRVLAYGGKKELFDFQEGQTRIRAYREAEKK